MAKSSSKKSGGAVAVACAFDKMVPIAKIKPNPKNPNKHPEAQIDALAKLIKHLGWRAPVTVSNRSGLVVRGHGRLMAAERLGLETVPVDFQDYASEADELSDLLADNKIPELSEIDKGLLKSLMSGLKDIGADLSLTAYDLSEIDRLIGIIPSDDSCPPIDKADELNKSWGVNFGDLWSIGNHRLLCGDSTNEKDVGRLMAGEAAVLFATDPPYGVAYNDETGGGKGAKIINDENDGPKLQMFLESCFTAWLPSLKKNAAWYLWHAQLTQGFFAAAAAAAGLLIHRQIIWVKPSLIMGHGDYHWKHELCFYGWRKNNRPPFYGDRNQDTVWNIGRESDGVHPTQKPTAIWDAPINNHTKYREVCAEPFAGSGSQFVICQNLNRRCYGIEINPSYCAVILQRMKDNFPGIKIKRVKK